MKSTAMKLYLTSTILLWTTLRSYAANDFEFLRSIQDELYQLNTSCKYESCSEGRISDTLFLHACQCETVCAQLGTCCIDARNIGVKPSEFRPTCRSLNGRNSFYMVDRCPPDNIWKNSCEEEWNGDDDVMKLTPVTSMFTFVTYKNYFCFRCHESTDEVVHWKVKLESSFEFDPSIDKSIQISPIYSHYYQTWIAPLGQAGCLVPVNLTIEVPLEIYNLPMSCDTELISRCSDTWSDDDVRKKCEAYMREIQVSRGDHVFKYRNVHCAKCNFEDLEKVTCKASAYGGVAYAGVPFSYTNLVDVNLSEGNKVGKIENCTSDELWDPHFKECKYRGCILPGYVFTNGSCVKS